MSKKDSPQRIPSLHITEKTLTQVLKKIYQERGSLGIIKPEHLARAILLEAKGLSCNSRSILVSNKKDLKKAEATLDPSTETYIFVKTLTHVRRQNKHRGVTMIDEAHSHWGFIKKSLIPLVKEFKREVGVSFEEACRLFITWGVFLMSNNYNLTKFSTLGPKILDIYLADKEIEDDPNETLTSKAIRLYCQWVYEKTGIQEYGSLENPLKYVEFTRMVKFCVSKGYKVEDYLKAQFDGLDWTGGVPDPAQLNSVSSVDRFIKFVSKNNIKITPKKQPQVNWDKILNHESPQ